MITSSLENYRVNKRHRESMHVLFPLTNLMKSMQYRVKKVNSKPRFVTSIHDFQ